MRNFAITGVAGYVAPRHLQAIHDTGNRLVAAVDPHDSVGILDRWFPAVAFFTEFERFDRHLELLRRRDAGSRVEWLSICAPNHLHDAHARLALRVGAHALCEKPLVLNPWNLDALAELERESSNRVFTVLQLRVHPSLVALKQQLDAEPGRRSHEVRLTYVTGRGPWYRYSWKGDPHRSGGVATNIGIHFFDMLIWLFGPVASQQVHLASDSRAAGFLELERANVSWFLSINAADLPVAPSAGEPATYRSVTVDGEEINFSGGFTDLHTLVYQETVAGRGFGIEDARPSVELVHAIRHTQPARPSGPRHPMVGVVGG
jgi:UDP-N-acetyl-2-amino-2-deoxyglucuronate dehydrogenase